MAVLAQPAAAQPVQTREDALAQDAGEYARFYQVPQEEALRRLRAQHDSTAPITATSSI
jgi:hypothetical protein